MVGRSRLGEIHIRNSYPPFLSWSPDGRFLVVVDSPDAGEPEALFVVSVETGEKHRLTSPPATVRADTTPAVSPDGRSVIFDRSGELHVLMLNEARRAAAEPRRIAERSVGAQQPTWSHDGKEILHHRPEHLAPGCAGARCARVIPHPDHLLDTGRCEPSVFARRHADRFSSDSFEFTADLDC